MSRSSLAAKQQQPVRSALGQKVLKLPPRAEAADPSAGPGTQAAKAEARRQAAPVVQIHPAKASLIERINRLKTERRAVILAHNYQLPR